MGVLRHDNMIKLYKWWVLSDEKGSMCWYRRLCTFVLLLEKNDNFFGKFVFLLDFFSFLQIKLYSFKASLCVLKKIKLVWMYVPIIFLPYLQNLSPLNPFFICLSVFRKIIAEGNEQFYYHITDMFIFLCIALTKVRPYQRGYITSPCLYFIQYHICSRVYQA